MPQEELGAWLRDAGGVTAASTSGELLAAIATVPRADHPAAWRALGSLLGHLPGESTPETVLARTVVAHVMDGDAEADREIAGYYEQTGGDVERYREEFARQGGVFLLGGADAGPRDLAEVEDLVERQLAGKAETSWALSHLRSGRNCVSLARLVPVDPRLFSGDVAALLDRAVASAAEAERRLDGRCDDPASRDPELVADLASLERAWAQLRVLVHTGFGAVPAGSGDDDPIDRLEAALRRKEEAGIRVRPARRITEAHMAVRVAASCCRAAEAAGGTPAPAGWPVPASLTRPSLLRAYLQIPGDENTRTTTEKTLIRHLPDPAARAAMIRRIGSFAMSGRERLRKTKGLRTTTDT
ncbi:hypothetical protein [Herbidospora cretacea]|uniref:hypothetical protein n=1 Tax=Herbidospora cretacea TaxID=28444 RepID=UPI0004C401F4|nr:hypothetical protein [Herbidospora cretacea]